MMEPGRADVFLLERATRGLRKEFAPLGVWSWRQKDPGAAELHIWEAQDMFEGKMCLSFGLV